MFPILAVCFFISTTSHFFERWQSPNTDLAAKLSETKKIPKDWEQMRIEQHTLPKNRPTKSCILQKLEFFVTSIRPKCISNCKIKTTAATAYNSIAAKRWLSTGTLVKSSETYAYKGGVVWSCYYLSLNLYWSNMSNRQNSIRKESKVFLVLAKISFLGCIFWQFLTSK